MGFVHTKFNNLPEIVRMIIIAVVGAGIGFISYELIYYVNPLETRASSSWAFAFIIGVFRQHALHRHFTFSDEKPYWKSLIRAYIMYSGALFITSGLNWYLTEVQMINHRLAWVTCLILSALISLVFLKKYVFRQKA